MRFTYNAYENMISSLLQNGYRITDYHHYMESDRPCILRHDVDYSLRTAGGFADFEAGLLDGRGVKSTYFILVTSAFYNVYSTESRRILKNILARGHEIGLHFDEKAYAYQLDEEQMKREIRREARLLEEAAGHKISVVSMHRPSKETLDMDLIPGGGILNSYGKKFFEEFKYLSDSRMFWREDVDGIILSREYPALHILTHPFWYGSGEATARERLMDFFSGSPLERYDYMNENFRNLKEFVEREELC